MDVAKELIRTIVRTLFTNPRQILIIDAVLQHSVLDMQDFNQILATTQSKDIRALITPLRAMKLIAEFSRPETRVTGSVNNTNINANRATNRIYYYTPFHTAIDSIKYKIAKLRKRVELRYKQDPSQKRKDWNCPRCKAEYDQLEILDHANEDGFFCARCGATLTHDIEAATANLDRANHEKIRTLNDQLKKFDDLIAKIDRMEIPLNDFDSAWERKKPVPRTGPEGASTQSSSTWMAIGKTASSRKDQQIVDAKNLTVNLTTGDEEEKAEAARKEAERARIREGNILPSWISGSAFADASNGRSTPNGFTNGVSTPASAVSEEGLDDDDEADFVDVKVDSSAVAGGAAGFKREHDDAFDDDDDDDENEDFEDAV